VREYVWAAIVCQGGWWVGIHVCVGWVLVLASKPIPSQRSRSPHPRRHEPHLALCGGEGLGVDCLLPICTGAARLLQPGGFLALETAGGEQAHYIADVLRHLRRGACAWGDRTGGSASARGSSDEEEGERGAFGDVRGERDLRGVDRFVTASAAL